VSDLLKANCIFRLLLRPKPPRVSRLLHGGPTNHGGFAGGRDSLSNIHITHEQVHVYPSIHPAEIANSQLRVSNIAIVFAQTRGVHRDVRFHRPTRLPADCQQLVGQTGHRTIAERAQQIDLFVSPAPRQDDQELERFVMVHCRRKCGRIRNPGAQTAHGGPICAGGKFWRLRGVHVCCF